MALVATPLPALAQTEPSAAVPVPVEAAPLDPPAAQADRPQRTQPRRTKPVNRQWQIQREAANANTIYLMASGPTGTALSLATDISLVLAGSAVRVLPVVGQGMSQNIHDVLLLRGVDLGMTQADTLEIVRESGQLPGLQDQIRYITVLGVSDIHLIAPLSIARFEDLAGRKVAADVAGSGTNLSARYVFEKLEIDAEIVDVDLAKALELLRRGEIDAIYESAVRPNTWLSGLRGEAAASLHLLPVPFDPRLSHAYQPSIIPSGSYPDLASTAVQTIAAPMVLISYDWGRDSDRYDRVAAFVTALFDRFEDLQQPERHASWGDVNIGADFPDWRRFQAAEDWIAARRAQAPDPAPAAAPTGPAADGDEAMRQAFATFLDSRGGGTLSVAERDALFEQFRTWMSSNEP